MPQIELYRGPYWAISQFDHWLPDDVPEAITGDSDIRISVATEILQQFHQIARQSGSTAVWLSSAGCLIVTDETEPEKGFRYYLWRKEAIDAAIANWAKLRLEPDDEPTGK